MIRQYGVLRPNEKDAHRAFFLVDPQGIVRERWYPGDFRLLPSEDILKAVQAIAGES